MSVDGQTSDDNGREIDEPSDFSDPASPGDPFESR